MAKKASMDGFVPRRPNRRVGGTIGGEKPADIKDKPQERPLLGDADSPQPIRAHISKSEIDESLRNIDAEDEQQPRKRRRRPSEKKQHSARRIWIKRILILLVVIILGIGLYVGIKAIIASSNVFQGNILGLFQNAPLKEDANGRSNIIIVGTSEDDPGHDGANLTDSMMILSLDQHKKNAFMISIPRDLYVQFGQACNSGYSGKINEYYNCVHDGTGVDSDRKALTKEAKFVGGIAGMNIQYGVNVNYTVLRAMVKAVGGSITVNIEGNGGVPYGVKPGSVMDSNFDWKCGPVYSQRVNKCPPRGHFIDYGPGPQKLDAEHALYLAQARGDSSPTWGLAQSNFDREKNQQKIIKALREKAVSAGVLTDFGKVSAIIDALGNNLRTTFETKELRTLVSLAQGIKDDDIKSISLIDGDDPVMGTGNVNGMSVVRPNAGTYDYTDLRALLKKRLSSDPVVSEAAPIAVFNGSGVSGMAQTEADKLTAASFTVETIDTAPTGKYAHFTLYQIGSGNSGTSTKLQQRYGVKVTKGKPPVTVNGDIKFVLIIGPKPVDTSSQ